MGGKPQGPLTDRPGNSRHADCSGQLISPSQQWLEKRFRDGTFSVKAQDGPFTRSYRRSCDKVANFFVVGISFFRSDFRTFLKIISLDLLHPLFGTDIASSNLPE